MFIYDSPHELFTPILTGGFYLSLSDSKSPQVSWGGFPCGVMVKVMDYEIVVSKFVLQSHYYVYFRANTLGKGMNPFILPAMGQIVPQLFFWENDFGIK